MCVVFTTQYNPVLWYLPVNIQIRIIPGNRPFSFRMIEIITLVLEDDLFAQHTKTMCEATRNKKLTVIVFCQFNRNMFSKCGRTLADIDSHIKNCTLDYPYQFALGKRRFLKMETANDTVARFGFIVLNKSRLTYI